jgi:predicted transcriptional regulator of viral defense system
MDNILQVRHWVDELPKKGKTSFTIKEAEARFPEKPIASVRRALARLSETGKIRSVWKGFYAITLPEYGIGGIVPPMDYIDQLLRLLDVNYYVSLLTAASYHGASHHAPQTFFIICNSNLRTKIKNGTKIEPVFKKEIPDKYISMINSRTASVRISNPELTAIDLLTYSNRVGGVNTITTVLAELVENIDFTKVDTDFIEAVAVTSIQRLGLLLDDVLSESAVAEDLYVMAKKSKIIFKSTNLVAGRDSKYDVVRRNRKWGIAVNCSIEGDL